MPLLSRIARALSIGVLLSAPFLLSAQARGTRGGAPAAQDSTSGIPANALNAFRFRGIGPANYSGRISDLAVHPDGKTWYIAVASGGVWKTENAGTTWSPIFDSQASYSTGIVVLDPNDPNTVWVGRVIRRGTRMYPPLAAGSELSVRTA
jgi:hypothetical protein